MNHDHSQAGDAVRRSASGKILGEAALVAILGAALAFAANQISPRGLALTHNYFPAGPVSPVRPVSSGTNAEPVSPAQFLANQMREKGLQLLDESQTVRLFRDPRFKQDIVVLIDAREEVHYGQGHIPGAYEFDPYRSGKYFDVVVPVCQKAEQIVVYCRGGDCDDSETAALLLRDMGIPNQKLFVYGGGITEWAADNLPVETGARNSGTLIKTNAVPDATGLPDTNK
jgi:rhodanese-related sulfurtransferase